MHMRSVVVPGVCLNVADGGFEPTCVAGIGDDGHGVNYWGSVGDSGHGAQPTGCMAPCGCRT